MGHDAGVTTHRITYRGPAALAVDAARLLADAAGVDLTASGRPERAGNDDEVTLVLTVDATQEAVKDAVRSLRERLPVGADLTVEGP